jgi:site-specific DNA-methyltransferase (adenine-specific)
MRDVRLIHGDCLDVLKTLEADSVDSLVTDPPAGIGFMGKEWDSFGVTRNRDAKQSQEQYRAVDKSRLGYGFSVEPTVKQREQFVRFLSVVFRECLRILKPGSYGLVWALPRTSHWTATALEDAGFEIRDVIHHLFGQGFPKGKSCLKPACENWILVRKPGGGKIKPLGIDECRIEGAWKPKGLQTGLATKKFFTNGDTPLVDKSPHCAGRWPANVVLDEEAARLLDEQSGASRFFYVAKASRSDRGEGNTHPTVKSTALMRHLVALVTPPDGLVLDPFAGSGSTLVACIQTGRQAIGIEIDQGYHDLAQRRITAAQNEYPLFAERA